MNETAVSDNTKNAMILGIINIQRYVFLLLFSKKGYLGCVQIVLFTTDERATGRRSTSVS